MTDLVTRTCALAGCDRPLPPGPDGRVSPARKYCCYAHMRRGSEDLARSRDPDPVPPPREPWQIAGRGFVPPVDPDDPRPWWEREACRLATWGHLGEGADDESRAEAASLVRMVAARGEYPPPDPRTVAELHEAGMGLRLDEVSWCAAGAVDDGGWAVTDGTQWSFAEHCAWYARTFPGDPPPSRGRPSWMRCAAQVGRFGPADCRVMRD